MEPDFKFELGLEVKDRITGFSGILVGRIQYMFGCNQYGIAPKTLEEGKMRDTCYFDEGRIEVTGQGLNVKSVQVEKRGGSNRDCPGGAK